jgi:flavodoxin
MNMQTLVVYFSKFGNTQKVAEAISERLGGNGYVRTMSSDELIADALQEVDLVVMGSPTHNMNLPKAVQPVFDNLPKRILRGTPVAVFDTSYKMSAFLSRFTAAKKLAKKLRKLGGKPLLPPETFHVMEREGPLFEGEMERAQSWADSITEKMLEK